jgi:AcrR family transcriptional regulator
MLMEQLRTTGVTQKAEQTRQRILDTALRLFATKGYERATLREIAAEAGCSLGLTYRYFTRKEELVLSLYRRLTLELEEQVAVLAPASLADRFQRTMLAQFALMAPYRDTLGAIFDAVLNPRSEVGVFSESATDVRQQSRKLFIMVVAGATDAPRKPQVDDLATVLYGLHLGFVLFWLQDRSPDTRITLELLAFVHDMLGLVRPLLSTPPVVKALVRLARILGPMLGDDSANVMKIDNQKP